MELAIDQTEDKDLNLVPPSTIYSAQDFQENLWPSLAFVPEQLGDLSIFPDMPLLQPTGWELENFGYSFDGPHVYADGHMEGALKPPEYYAYSPQRFDTWEDGLQAIEDFDWPVFERPDEIEVPQKIAEAVQASSQVDLPADGPAMSPNPEPIKEAQATSPHVQQLPADDAQATSPQVQQLEADDAQNTTITSPCLPTNNEDVPAASAVSSEAVMQGVASHEPVPKLAEAEPDLDIAMVDADAVGPSMVFGDTPLTTLDHPDSRELVPTTIKAAQESAVNFVEPQHSLIPTAVPESTSRGTPTSHEDTLVPDVGTHMPDEVTFDTHEVTPLPELAASRSPEDPVISDQKSKADSGDERRDAQLHEAAAEDAVVELHELHAPGYLSPSNTVEDDQEQVSEEPNADLVSSQMTTEAGISKTDQVPIPAYASLMPTTRQRSPPSILVEVQDRPEIPTFATNSSAARKRGKLPWLKSSTDPTEEPPVKKKIKTEATPHKRAADMHQIPDLVEQPNVTPAPAKKQGRAACKSRKEVPQEDPQEVESTKDGQEDSRSALSNQPKKAVPNQADILFEDDIKPSEGALNRESDDVESPVDNYDDDMHEHLSDVLQSPTPIPKSPNTFPRSPKNTVSNRELEALESTLAPGMHLGLHLQPDQTATRTRQSTPAPVKNPNADGTILLDVDETPESESTPTASKKRAGPPKKGPAPKRARTEAKKPVAKPRAGRGKKAQQESEIEADAMNDQEPQLFPTPMFETRQEAPTPTADADTQVPPKIISRKTATGKSKKKAATEDDDNAYVDHADLPIHSKKHTRNDTKVEEPESALDSPAPSVPAAKGSAVESAINSDTWNPFPEDDALPPSTPAAPATPASSKSRYRPILAKPPTNGSRPSLLKSATTARPGTPASSVASAASSPPVKNKFGFKPSPMKTRSAVAKTTATEGKAPRSRKGKGKAEVVADDTPEPEVVPKSSVKNKKGAKKQDDVEEEVVDVEKPERRSARTARDKSATPATAKEPEQPEQRRSTRNATAAAPDTTLPPNDTPSTTTLPSTTVKGPELRRSTRQASTQPPQAETAPATKKTKVKIEAPEPDRRTTRRASAIELEEKEANIGKRLRSGD